MLVKQHTEPSGSAKKQGLDFFLPVLVKAQIPVTEINKLPPVSVSHQSVPEGRLGRLLEQLPPPVHYGVTRLAPVLRTNPFDVVSLWQDGTCLFGALAALLAGAPPSTWCSAACRRTSADRFREEYPELYQALAGARRALRQQQPQGGRSLFRNGSAFPSCASMCCTTACRILPPTPPPRTRTNGGRSRKHGRCHETIGGVFRLEPDKRPQLWIKLAALYLKQRPRARFVIVGDGRLHENIVTLAEELQVTERLLLVGLSNHVGTGIPGWTPRCCCRATKACPMC